MTAPRGPGKRAGITLRDILDAAHGLLKAKGHEGLSMRAIARVLGVAPNALYSHTPSKQALIDELLDDVLAAVPSPTEEDATQALSTMMTSTYDTLLRHGELVPLFLARQGARGRNAWRLGDQMLLLLERAGVDAEAAREAQRVLIVYTIGFAAIAAQSTVEVGATARLQPRDLRQNFMTGLEWLLRGVTGQQ
ncbi:TetR/AcrR family transcriptional regulator [Hoyosella altamirensis]|uniref:AcrR family transcriptional regulator n=1 Tax=Hoyosella altamirensis TaxID=616997 RepID=A0A839RSE3_9ACTN|nr:TetR/AcrR family transcriptional regulator [Hoyosella altamirensis]MBB3039036.1 AcrR family transcriptional regulator [Hoyosella altamirensis]